MSETPQDAGRRFEAEFAGWTGAQLTPGSGNMFFAKMDASGGGITISLKSTSSSQYSWSAALYALRECIEYVNGPSGPGGLSAVGIRVDNLKRLPRSDEDVVIMSLEDWTRLVQEQRTFSRVSKAELRRQRATQTVVDRQVEAMGD